MIDLTIDQIVTMCNGSLAKNSNPNAVVKRVNIDSRQTIADELFVAIIGADLDGHQFVDMAFKNGAVAALVNKNCKLDRPNLIYVSDTTHALGELAQNYRLKFNIPIVAITGSNGKTTLKEMVKSICLEEFGSEHVLANIGSFNNHWGMPLTLLQLDPKHKVAILEMGMNHSGELTYLSNLAKPTIAIVNNVMLAHVGFFKTLDNVALAKSEIFSGLILGGTACINTSNPYSNQWISKLKEQDVKLFLYGKEDTKCYLKHVDDDGNLFINSSLGQIKTKLQILGAHNCTNAVSAATIAINLGCSIKSIENGLANYKGYVRRLEQKTAFNGALLIDDTYNANPDSVKAAILAIAKLPKPHWLILGDLGELGELNDKLHSEIGQFAFDNKIDVLLSIGDLAKIAYNSFAGTKLHFDSQQAVVKYCVQNLPKESTLLVKGSNVTKLDDVVKQLIK